MMGEVIHFSARSIAAKTPFVSSYPAAGGVGSAEAGLLVCARSIARLYFVCQGDFTTGADRQRSAAAFCYRPSALLSNP